MTRPNQIIPTAEPFFFPGNNTGILLVHGFTGAPKEMRGLGEYLHSEHHFSTMGVRLGGHATHPEDMIRSNWTDWTASVEDAFFPLKHFTDRIFFVGLSMGGILIAMFVLDRWLTLAALLVGQRPLSGILPPRALPSGRLGADLSSS